MHRIGADNIFTILLLLLVGFAIVGNEACQEDHFFATQVSATATGTAEDSATATATDTADDEVTSSSTATSTSATATATATDTTDSSASASSTASSTATTTSLNFKKSSVGADFLSSLREMVRGSFDPGKTAQPVDATWLGKQYDNQPVPGVSVDTDSDGFTDQLEIDSGSDPSDAKSTPGKPVTSLARRLAGVDDDVDGLSLEVEKQLGTNSALSDSDEDGFSDGVEYLSESDPLNKSDVPLDTDGDGLSDAFESDLGLNPHSADTDRDRLRDDLELALASDPRNNDSDLDGILDGKEVELGSDPTIPEVR